MNDQSHLDSLAEADLDNQRVLLRTDLDASVSSSGELIDDIRIRQAVPTVRALQAAGARVVIASRFGEFASGPGTGVEGDKAPSIEPAAFRLAELLGTDVILPDGCTGDSVKRVLSQLRDGQVCVLENLCLEGDAGPGREALARRLLEYVDMFVADSLRALSIESACTTILPRLLETRLSSPRLLAEVAAVARVRARTDAPRLVVWGDAHLSENLPLLRSLIGERDEVFLGGVAGSTMLTARGGRLGKSRVEEGYLAGARTLSDQLGSRLLLPTDVVAAESPRTGEARTLPAWDLPSTAMALDIGPETRKALKEAISRAGNVVWIGPIGVHQSPAYAAGTRSLVESLAEANVFTLVAGDDSVAAARSVAPEVADRLDCVAAGGQATLTLLNGNKLPGLDALKGHGP